MANTGNCRLPQVIKSALISRRQERSAVAVTAVVKRDETTFDFIAPPRWDTGIADQAAAAARLAALEAQINDEVYRLYGISDADARPSRRSWRAE